MRRPSRAMSRRGDPPQVPASGPPRYRPKSEQPGDRADELREYAAAKQSHEQAAIRRKSLPPDHPVSPQSEQPGDGAVRVAGVCGGEAELSRLAISASPCPGPPLIAFSLRNLGLQGLTSGVGVGDAVPGLAEATDLFQAEQLRLAVAQAEQEQLATAALARSSLGNLLAATLITRAEPASAYDRVVRVKGSVTALQRWARQARDAADPDTARLLDRLRQVTRQIVGLSMDQPACAVEVRSQGRAGRDPNPVRRTR